MEEIRGTLGIGVVPEVLREVFLGSRSGVLQIVHGADHCVCHFEDGLISDCEATMPGCQFGDVLVGVGFLTAADRDACLEIAATSNRRLGSTLVRHGLLDNEGISQGLRIQLREVFARVLQWPEGGYSFIDQAGPPQGAERASVPRVDPRIGLLDAVWSLVGDPLIDQLMGPLERKVRRTAVDRLAGMDLALNTTDAFVMSRMDGVSTLAEIIQLAAVAEEEAKASLAGLLCVGAAEVEGAPPPRASTGEIQRSEMVRLAARLHAADPYEVLGLKPTARTEEIRSAYVHLLKICDPAATSDREMKPLLERMTELLGQAFRATERLQASAPVTASDPPPPVALRGMKPPLVVRGPEPAPEAPRMDPERALELAEQAHEEGKTPEALALFHDAILGLSGRARGRARVRRCKILLATPHGEKLGIEELKAAVGEDPGNTEAYLLLGRVYRDARALALATSAFKKVLSLDPRNAIARAALREIDPKAFPGTGKVKSTKGPSLLRKLFRR